MKIAAPQEIPITSRVQDYYWNHDLNCATTTLKILAEIFEVNLSEQIINAAIGMHGAGQYGAQCGLVEGMLMFLGIIGREQQIPDATIVDKCREFAQQFENEFQSLSCKKLRPEGFSEDNPPHLCEKLTCNAIEFNRNFVIRFLQKQ